MSEQKLMIAGESGQIEARADLHAGTTLLLMCHPHPQHEGTMDNKVVTTVVRAARQLGMQTVRFNYRGVGNSEGVYGNVTGEYRDAGAVLDAVGKQSIYQHLVLAGFSFGSYIAAKLAEQYHADALLCLSPPIERMPFAELKLLPQHCVLIQGMADDVVAPQCSLQWALDQGFDCYTLFGVGHYYHGRLLSLRHLVQAFLCTKFSTTNENQSHLP